MSKLPSHDLVILRKSDQTKGKIGAGWLNEDESISIVLNPLVTLTESKDVTIRLFVRKPYESHQAPPVGKYKDQSELIKPQPKEQVEDDIPF